MSTTAVDPTNEAQARAWDGHEGALWTTHHELLDGVLGHYQPSFAQACGVHAGDQVLDLGCGTGGTTRAAAAAAGPGTALGVDLSSRMIRMARALAAGMGLPNARFLRADAQVHPFEPARYDVVMSRTGAMFFGRPEQAFGNVAAGMRSGARLTLLTWQDPERNEWFGAFAKALLGTLPTLSPHGPGPFSMSDPGTVTRLLEGAGFSDIEITGLAGPVTYGPDAAHAHALLVGLLGWMLERRPPEERTRAVQDLYATLAAHHGPGGIQFDSATWLITAHRT